MKKMTPFLYNRKTLIYTRLLALANSLQPETNPGTTYSPKNINDALAEIRILHEYLKDVKLEENSQEL